MHAYIGEDQQSGSHFLLDTTTPFTVVTSKGCLNCYIFSGGVFDPSKSDTFKAIGDPDKPENLTVGTSLLQGYWGSDTMMLKGSKQNKDHFSITDFEFFVVTKYLDWTYQERVDGIIGLGARQSSSQQTATLLEALNAQGLI